MRLLLTALVCISVVSCKPRDYNAGKSLSSDEGSGQRSGTLQADEGTYYSVSGQTAGLVKGISSEGYQLMGVKAGKVKVWRRTITRWEQWLPPITPPAIHSL
jgi:hypothetical protein